MSKGSSHLFTNTTGEGKALIAEVQQNGEKQRIAIQVSTNGYIVGANLKSAKE